MARYALILVSLIPLTATQFVFPEVILQAGYPAGFRAFMPDFPGCQRFAFHGKINNPFTQPNELGSIFQEVLRPQNGFWVIQDVKLILTPGDVIFYWTNVMKDGVDYPKRNQTWKVPGPEGSVDILSPIKPPKENPQKVKETEPTSTEEATSLGMEASPTSTEETTHPTPSSETSTPILTTTVAENATETVITTDQTTSSPTESMSTTSPSTPTTQATLSTTTKSPSSITTKAIPSTIASTTTPAPSTTQSTPTSTEVTTPNKITTTTEKPPTSEKPETPNPENTDNSTLPEKEELLSPLPLERSLTSEFPEEPPAFPFPGLYPPPVKPMMPSSGPGFEICSNPWNFQEKPGETRTQKLERQVAKLQCQLALFQRGYNQLSNTVETELTDIKKLMYGMVSRMASLESVLRSTPFG